MLKRPLGRVDKNVEYFIGEKKNFESPYGFFGPNMHYYRDLFCPPSFTNFLKFMINRDFLKSSL